MPRCFVLALCLMSALGCQMEGDSLGPQTERLRWALRFGDEEADQALAMDVNTDRITIAGEYRGSIDFDPLAPVPTTPAAPGVASLFLARFDLDGRYVLDRRYPGGQTAILRTASLPEGLVFAGAFFGDRLDLTDPPLVGAGAHDAFLMGMNESGAPLWGHRFGDMRDQLGTTLAVSPKGDIFFAGRFKGDLSFEGAPLLSSVGGFDIFLMCFSPQGALRFAHRYGGTGDDIAGALMATPDGVILAGRFEDTIIIGEETHMAQGARDVFIAGLNAEGAPLFSQRYGALGSEQEIVTMAMADDRLFVSGTFSGSLAFGETRLQSEGRTDIFLAELDARGALVQVHAFGGGDFDIVRQIATGPRALWMTGSFKGALDLGGAVLQSAGGNDLFLARFDLNPLTLTRAERFGDDHPDQVAASMAVDRHGHAIVLGVFGGTLMMNEAGASLMSEGDLDVLLASFR